MTRIRVRDDRQLDHEGFVCAVNSGGTMMGIAPSAISPDSASILGQVAPMIFG